MLRSFLCCRYYHEVSIVALDPRNSLVEAQFKRIMLRRLPVVFQRLDASWLIRRANQRKIANFEQLRSREKHHFHWIVEDRIAEAGLVDDQRPHSGALGFNGGGQAPWPPANADNVVGFHANFSLPGVFRNCKLPQLHCFAVKSRISLGSA